MQPACAGCVFAGYTPQTQQKSYALVLLTGSGSLEKLWCEELQKAKAPAYLAPMYTHCAECQQTCWIARSSDAQMALQQHFTDRETWDRMWRNLHGMHAQENVPAIEH